MQNPIKSLVLVFKREFSDIFENKKAVFGGVFGTGTIISLTVVSLSLTANATDKKDDDELPIDFIPGELMKKGIQIDPQDIPEKIIIEETVAAEQKEESKITTDEKALPNKEPKKIDKPKTDVNSTEKPNPNKKDVKESDKNRDSNTEYKDLPTVKDPIGNPFGDENGWSDMMKDGDPWATEIMKRLNNLDPQGYAGVGNLTYKFQLTVCANGKIDYIKDLGFEGDLADKGRIKLALERLVLPIAPPEITKLLNNKCKRIPYTFIWKNGKTK